MRVISGTVSNYDHVSGLGTVQGSSVARKFFLTSFYSGCPARPPKIGEKVEIILQKSGQLLLVRALDPESREIRD